MEAEKEDKNLYLDLTLKSPWLKMNSVILIAPVWPLMEIYHFKIMVLQENKAINFWQVADLNVDFEIFVNECMINQKCEWV